MEQYADTEIKDKDTVKDSMTIKYQRDPLLERAVNSINRLAETVLEQRRSIQTLENQVAELRAYINSIKK